MPRQHIRLADETHDQHADRHDGAGQQSRQAKSPSRQQEPKDYHHGEQSGSRSRAHDPGSHQTRPRPPPPWRLIEHPPADGKDRNEETGGDIRILQQATDTETVADRLDDHRRRKHGGTDHEDSECLPAARIALPCGISQKADRP